jgi:hypothetical protein
MATDNNSYFSNANPGTGLQFDGNIYRLDATPKYALGFGAQRADGSCFRYAQFGAATNRGVLVSQDVSETSIPDTDNGIVAPASAVTTTDGTLGSRFIQITMDGIIANQFAGAYLCTTDDTGEGYVYRIKGNTASGNPASLNYRLELYDGLIVAVDNTTDYSINGLPWNDVEIATQATDNIISGVSMRVSTAALPFQFVQTKGICTVLQDVKIPTAGQAVCLSTLTSGAVSPYWSDGSYGASDFPLVGGKVIVGFCFDPGDSTGHSAIMLNLPW